MGQLESRAIFGLALAILVMWVVRAIRKPEIRQMAFDNILIIVAFLVLLLNRATTLSPSGQRGTYIAAAVLLVGGFGKSVWDATPWK